jgi:protein-S-isoprenylcysteine O-methyltransferase Ste14
VPVRLRSVIAFLVAAGAMVGLWRAGALLAQGWAGGAVQVGAVALMAWARITFGRRSFHAAADPTAGGLVTSGPYRFLRHPIYAAVLYFAWAGALGHAGWWPVLLATLVTLGLGYRMLAEERLVAARYPEYQAWAARTRRLIPGIL